MRHFHCDTITRRVAKQAKEAPSPHEVRLAPLDTNPVFESLRGNVFESPPWLDQQYTASWWYIILNTSWWYSIFIALNVKTLAGELNSDLKANLNGYTYIFYLIQIWIRLKKLYFLGNDRIISLTNLFQHLLSAFNIWMKNWIKLPYLMRNFQINTRIN